MASALILLIIVLVLAVGFDFVNGFHDTANAIATVVATRVLSPAQAILMSASLNFVGALTGTAVAQTIAKDMVPAELMTQHEYTVVAALLAAITWNLITWFYGIPSSSSHALIGGMLGAAIAATDNFGAPKWGKVLEKVLLPLVVSPLVGFAVAWLLMIFLLRTFSKRTPSQTHSLFGRLQIFSSAFMAYSHGGNDAQKTMGVMAIALLTYQHRGSVVTSAEIAAMEIPLWIKITAATAMGCGTALGGWRVIKTMGHKITKLQPIHGFAAETAAASVIEIASHLGSPLSTTQVISSSILGAGASRGFHAVRWNIAGSILTAWILTIPTCMILAGAFFSLLRILFHIS